MWFKQKNDSFLFYFFFKLEKQNTEYTIDCYDIINRVNTLYLLHHLSDELLEIRRRQKGKVSTYFFQHVFRFNTLLIMRWYIIELTTKYVVYLWQTILCPDNKCLLQPTDCHTTVKYKDHVADELLEIRCRQKEKVSTYFFWHVYRRDTLLIIR